MNEQQPINVGIIGGAGYTGGEMLRILLRHPGVAIKYIHSRSNAGEPVSHVHSDLVGDTDLHFTGEVSGEIDVLFLCVGHGEARAFLERQPLDERIKVIDLSQDFRLVPDATFGGRQFVYGLPEYNRGEIETAKNIANPGCFATAIQLGLLPLAKAGLLGEVHTTGITGATGAGQKLQASSHFAWRANNVQAYKSLAHQHMNEINQTMGHLQPGHGAIRFMPWRGDFTRGIFVTSYTRCSLSLAEATALYKEYYASHAFTHVSDSAVDLKQVVNTNKCLVSLEKVGDDIVVHTVIDNLLKGASGQAVQNMNIMFGLPEQMGLNLKANLF